MRKNNSDGITRGLMVAGALGLGAGLMYMLDPDRGGYRRGIARDKIGSALKTTGENTGQAVKNLANRAQGMAAETQARFRPSEATDSVIIERVRSEMGGAVTHPHSVNVNAVDGRVILSGPILASEVNGLMDRVSHVPGVSDIENDLTVYPTADDIPGLQGEPRETKGALESERKPSVLDKVRNIIEGSQQ